MFFVMNSSFVRPSCQFAFLVRHFEDGFQSLSGTEFPSRALWTETMNKVKNVSVVRMSYQARIQGRGNG